MSVISLWSLRPFERCEHAFSIFMTHSAAAEHNIVSRLPVAFFFSRSFKWVSFGVVCHIFWSFVIFAPIHFEEIPFLPLNNSWLNISNTNLRSCTYRATISRSKQSIYLKQHKNSNINNCLNFLYGK